MRQLTDRSSRKKQTRWCERRSFRMVSGSKQGVGGGVSLSGSYSTNLSPISISTVTEVALNLD